MEKNNETGEESDNDFGSLKQPSVSDDGDVHEEEKNSSIVHLTGTPNSLHKSNFYPYLEPNKSTISQSKDYKKFEKKIAYEDVYGDGAGVPSTHNQQTKRILRKKQGDLEYLPLVLIKDPSGKENKE